MTITKEAIEARLEELQHQLNQVTANGNAIGGAIQDCKFWLAELNKQEADANQAEVTG